VTERERWSEAALQLVTLRMRGGVCGASSTPLLPSVVLDRDMEALDAEIAALEASLGVMAP
jgi:hypothetical protein